MNRKIRFGLAGCGRIALKHIEAIANLYKEAEFVCACDVMEERAAAKASVYIGLLAEKGIRQKINEPRVYVDLDEMLDTEKIDVLSVCTLSGLHPVHGIKAAQRHINVLSEKPMATNLKAADDLIKECDRTGVKLFIVKQNRLNAAMQLLKKAVDQGRFGKIYMLLSNVLWARPQSYYDEAKWRGTREFDGGAFSNQACHYADTLQWLGGSVESVTAMTGTLARSIETEDTGSAVIKFENGAIGNINVTMLAYPRNLEGSITVIGEKGTVKIGGPAINRIEIWEFEEKKEEDKLVALSLYDINSFGHTEYYKNVLEVLKGNAEPYTDGREGRKSLELVMGIYESARTGKTIHLPFEPQEY